jgi:hypothetical protein
MPFTNTIAELAVFHRLSRASGRVAPEDVRFAEQSDIGPEDVATFREATRRLGVLIIMRCPKRGAVAFHGTVPPKRWADGHDSAGNTVKSGESGLGVHPERGNIFVSDYDMMSLWARKPEGGYRKLFASALISGAERGKWDKEAMEAVRVLNTGLQSKLQHGAQDDFDPPHGHQHPGVRPDTRFAAFREGEASYLADMAACKAYYSQWGLYWPYNGEGQFTKALRP